jgi:hypoxanthine phosphoribosyltransferase
MLFGGKITLHQDVKEILVSTEQIRNKIIAMGKQITNDYQEKDLLCVCILKGAAPFMADLIREIELPMEIDFMACSSYGASTKSSGQVRILKDLDSSVQNRDILLVEDIIDTGLTLSYLVDLFKGREARSVKTVTLLDKPSRRQANLVPDYFGFQVPDKFVVGFGLDYDEKYRNLPYIGVLKEEVYSTKNT